ncbi:hypothetical protein Cgig2_027866 [Carnegiea gigantea]|uniref:ABC transporter family G domain-containing protein n=1 Tax=Carnegiea gigantea TaxID=171969 RepID=A0A9Q1GPN3_9CARY|nr:hypothetical protein Cgig2_027866 [Carnegiea gigantea]
MLEAQLMGLGSRQARLVQRLMCDSGLIMGFPTLYCLGAKLDLLKDQIKAYLLGFGYGPWSLTSRVQDGHVACNQESRVGKQRLRDARIQAVDYLILLLAGACLGTIAKVSDESFGAVGYTYTVIAVSLLCKIAALRSFALDKLHYWRESASGISSLAHFLAKDTVDHFNTIVKPLVYLSMFYFFNNPRSTILENYLVLICLVYCVTGIAYVLAICFEPGPAQLWSVLLPVVFTLIATQDKAKGFLSRFEDFCYPKWAMEAFIIANAQRLFTLPSAESIVTRLMAIPQSTSYFLQAAGASMLTAIVLVLFFPISF